MKQEDRNRLARTLHDGVGQTLAGLALQIEWVAARVGDAALADRLRKLAGAAREGLDDVRKVSTELRNHGASKPTGGQP